MSTPPETQAGGGLRERSKARRRDAIQRAAMKLFAERGYDATTVADIAAEAEVAPRTVSMYFPTKADLALSWGDEMGRRFTEVHERNQSASLTEVIEEWLRGEVEAQDPERASLAWDMLAANPSLRALSAARLRNEFALGAPLLAEELGLPLHHPMLAIVGAAFSAAIDEYHALVARGRRGTTLHEPMMTFLRLLVEAGRQSSGHDPA